MKQLTLTILWYDVLKGIGEGFDSDGVIHFINAYYINWSRMHFIEKNTVRTIIFKNNEKEK